MKISLRSYQQSLLDQSTLPGNLLMQADTGAGKTRVLAAIANKHEFVLVVAHRNILVKQLSRELARFAIKHDVIASKYTRRQCIIEHRKLGAEHISKSGKYVVSIDTLLSHQRRDRLHLDTSKPYTLLIDEAHHMVDENKWGKLLALFPNARVIGVTATPCRLDQVSLARGKGGVFDTLIQADELKKDSVQTLIRQGFVTDFKCYSVPEVIDHTKLKIGSTDYVYKTIKEETGRFVYQMAGDAVKHYKRLANGKQALVFCLDIEIATITANTFKTAGLSAAAIHSKMSATEINRVFQLFEQRVIHILCNVDMIGEGVDVPAIEALIMLRKTASFGLYRQWIGRSLRPAEGKEHAIIIDHAGNVRTFGLPDKHIDWSLENPPSAVKSNLYPCPECRFLVSPWIDTCPECGEDLSGITIGELQGANDVLYIDVQLVEMKRRQIQQQKQHETVLAIKNTPTFSQDNIVGKVIYKTQLWFIQMLESQLSVAELNVFFSQTNHKDFWLSQFNIKDHSTNNVSKCERVYKKWLKSKS